MTETRERRFDINSNQGTVSCDRPCPAGCYGESRIVTRAGQPVELCTKAPKLPEGSLGNPDGLRVCMVPSSERPPNHQSD